MSRPALKRVLEDFVRAPAGSMSAAQLDDLLHSAILSPDRAETYSYPDLLVKFGFSCATRF